MQNTDILVELLLSHGDGFDRIPDELIPVVRRLLFAAMSAQRERDAQIVEQVIRQVYLSDRGMNAAAIAAAIRAQPTDTPSPPATPAP